VDGAEKRLLSRVGECLTLSETFQDRSVRAAGSISPVRPGSFSPLVRNASFCRRTGGVASIARRRSPR
jgi:hypothetical protein